MNQFKEKGFCADLLVVDPPRKGLDQNLIRYLQKGEIKNIIYVSCNPSTLVKNLNHLQKSYKVVSVDTLDLFPLSSRIEVLTTLRRI